MITFNPSGFSYYSTNLYGCFCGDSYLGLKIIAGGQTYFGWARLQVDCDGSSLVLTDYAVNTIPDSALVAGQGSAGCSANIYTVTPAGNQFICNNDSVSVTLHNVSVENIQWTNNGVWLSGETDSTLIVTQEGFFLPLISDSICSVITTGVLFDTIHFAVDTFSVNETCENSNALIHLTLSGNSPSYLYQWSNGVTTKNLDNIPAGNYSVTVTTSVCSLSDIVSFLISNTGLSPIPFIYSSDNILSTDTFVAYHWFRNNSSIPGATNLTYFPQQIGYYQVKVWNNDGCTAISDSFYFLFDNVYNIESSLFQFSIENKFLHFQLTDNSLLGNQIEIVNELGQLVTTVTVSNQNPEADLSALPGGIYFFHIRSKQKTYSGKFFIEKI